MEGHRINALHPPPPIGELKYGFVARKYGTYRNGLAGYCKKVLKILYDASLHSSYYLHLIGRGGGVGGP